MILETNGLILRLWRDADAEDLYRYASDHDIGPRASFPRHQNAEKSRHCIRTYFSTRPEAYAVCLKTDNRPIGAIELKLAGHTHKTDQRDACELGFWMGKPFWGHGLIPEAAQEMLRHAFEDLGMAEVYCAYYDGNNQSKRVQEKLGFQHRWTKEGVYLPLLDEVRTEHVQSITKAQWLERIQASSDGAEGEKYV